MLLLLDTYTYSVLHYLGPPWGQLARLDLKPSNVRPVRLAYQPPANSTFLSEQISHQQSVSSTFSQNKSASAINHQAN
jgi:hypothetical protein